MEEDVYDNVPGQEMFENASYEPVGKLKKNNAMPIDGGKKEPTKMDACSRNWLLLLTLLVVLIMAAMASIIAVFTWQFLDLNSKVDMIQLSSTGNQQQTTGTYILCYRYVFSVRQAFTKVSSWQSYV